MSLVPGRLIKRPASFRYEAEQYAIHGTFIDISFIGWSEGITVTG
jgi:hypothetical protein